MPYDNWKSTNIADESPANAPDEESPDTDRPKAWKIRAWKTNQVQPRICTVYCSVPTYDDALAIARVLEGTLNRHSIATKVEKWDPDHPDVDSDGAVSLENAILWALGR